MTVKFVVPGQPVGKGRPRFTRNGHAYTPQKTREYEELVKAEYRRQCGTFRFADDAMLDMRIIAYFRIPKSASKKRRAGMKSGEIRPTIKCDADNLIKILCDAGNTLIYRDDTQIVDCQVRKFYSDTPRVVVTIREAQYYQSKQEE